MKTISKIENLPAFYENYPFLKPRQRVAVYARVSTSKEEQQSSLVLQEKYFTEMILARSDWDFAGAYIDNGISGSTTKARKAFNELISDALSGKIDLILTKSISRFARNTLDTLNTVRTLKAHNIIVHFEKEDIYTSDEKCEFMLTLLSSLAQEESRSISENIRWSAQKRFSNGKYTVPFGRFLGYTRGSNGELKLDKSEAVTIKKIFKLFISGLTPHRIASLLTEENIPTPSGKLNWSATTIRSILENEKYKGDALMQKSFTIDFLTKKKKLNEGELPRYYVENGHEAIINPILFDYVQEELSRRLNLKNGRYSGCQFISNKLICKSCGAVYAPKTWHSTTYRDIVWQCNRLYAKEEKCKSIRIYDIALQASLNQLLSVILNSSPTIIKITKNSIENVIGDDKSRNRLIARYIRMFRNPDTSMLNTRREDWVIILKEAIISFDGNAEWHFLDDSVVDMPVLDITPRK